MCELKKDVNSLINLFGSPVSEDTRLYKVDCTCIFIFDEKATTIFTQKSFIKFDSIFTRGKYSILFDKNIISTFLLRCCETV